MSEPEKNTSLNGRLLSADLVSLYDEVTEFNDYCAFLCDACASLAMQNEMLGRASASGLTLSVDYLKARSERLKLMVKSLHERQCLSETRTADKQLN